MAASALALLAVAGCASGQPDLADILVSTTPPGAACVLSRAGAPIAHVSSTPGIARFSRTNADITVVCRRHGFAAATGVTHPHPIDAGVVGTLSGDSSYDYEDQLSLTLVPRPQPTP